MSATETNRKIKRIDSRLGVLKGWVERLEAARTEVLLRLPASTDHGFAANKIRAELSQIEGGCRKGEEVFVTAADVRDGLTSGRQPGLKAAREEAELLQDQRAALEASLPSAEEVAKAETKAAGLVKRATEQSEQFAQSWSAFMAALAEAEAAGRHVAATRSKAQAAINELSSLVEQYGLEVEVPREPRPDPAESKTAGITCSLLQSVSYSRAIDRSLDAELASARRQLERAAEAA